MSPAGRTGLVLAGGAARGAYTAGVMRFLYQDLAERMGRAPWPDIVSGTSVGALNAVFAASRDRQEMSRLTRVWRELEIPQVYEVHASALLNLLRSTFRPVQGAAMLDADPLYDLVRREAPMGAVARAVDAQQTTLVVGVTAVATGYNVLFVDSADPRLRPSPLPGARVRRVRIRPRHLLASAAIPILFPAVDLGGELFVDGGLRQNTPLRPAIWSGAQRVLIIGVAISKEAEGRNAVAQISPTLPFLAGKSLNALLLDPVERDLLMANRITEILEWGRDRYGESFVQAAERELDLCPVKTLFLRPTENLGRLASESLRERPPRVPRNVERLLYLVADDVNSPSQESDLLSYLLFDRGFTERAEDLGYRDARAREEELVRFLAPDSAEAAG